MTALARILAAPKRAVAWLLETAIDRWDAADEDLAMRGADPGWRRGDPHE